MLVSLESVSFSYGDNLIFSDVEFAVNEGDRIGLIGANGEGKTTLLKLILGELIPESGNILRKNGIKTGYLDQSGTFEGGTTVFAEAMKVFSEELSAISRLEELSARLSEEDAKSDEYRRISAQIERLQSFIAAKDAYNVKVRVNAVLNGMGFGGRENERLACMSGGEKTRFKLARLLLEEPDLLILDEPTNHLDVPTLFWLEDYLKTFKGALLIVSHDRYFLDRTVTKIAELENRKLAVYKGNYTKFKVSKAERVARLSKEWEAQRLEREKLRVYIEKNIARATTAKSAQSRVKQLEKMPEAEKPFQPPRPPEFEFLYDEEPYVQALTVKDINLDRGGKRLITAGNLCVARGDKLALVGTNGTGKSSLLSEIADGANPAVRVGRHVRFARFDQEGANLCGANAVLDEIRGRNAGATQTEIRLSLAKCGLFAEDMQKTVNSLSGGERAKLALCVLENERGNFLLLDEPTNHLDLPARESLERALAKFGGTLIVVSHDRYFLSAVANRVAEIEDGKLNVYECGYGEYAEIKKRIAQEKLAAEEQKRRADSAAKNYRSKTDRSEEAKKKSEEKRIAGEISALEEEQEGLYAKLASPEGADFAAAKRISERLEEIRNLLDALYKEYESVI